MAIYNYKAKDKYGVDVVGEMESISQGTVAGRLADMGYTPLFIVEKEPSAFEAIEKYFQKFQSVKSEEMIVFVRQLSSILAAGVPLLESLEAVYEQVQSKKFREIIYSMRQDIEGGSSFSDALAKNKNTFSNVFIAMVRAGEKAGILEEVLDSLGTLMERDYENVQKIKSATRYPIMVISALVVAFIVIITFIVPKFSTFYSGFKMDLPLPTRILIGINYTVVNYWLYLILAIVGFVYGFKKFISTDFGRLYMDKVAISIPLFGPLVNKLILARFSRILSAMLKAGIPIIEALNITKDTISNKILAKVIDDVRESVVRGSTLSDPMRGAKVFPPLVVQMVSIGEKSGSLEPMLAKVADYFDRDTDYAIRNLTPLLEPLLIFVLGFFVLLLALGVFLPMWDVIKIAQ